MSNPWLSRDAGDRVWPPPEAGRYPLQFRAQPVLSPWLRITGWTTSPTARLARMLYQHRRAFDAECLGFHRTADFFWREALHAFCKLWPAQTLWDAAARAWPELPRPTGEGLRRRIATELFIDGHMAFANGCLASPDDAGRARADVHLRHLETLLALRPQPVADLHKTMLPAVQALVDADEAAHRYDQAIARIRNFRLPALRDALADLLVGLIHRRGLARLAPEPNGRELDDARRLAGEISELKALAAERGHLRSAHESIARLLHLRSLRLANGGKVSEALVACEEATCHSPGFEAAVQAMTQLTERMKALQEQERSIRDHLKRHPGHLLNAEGRRLVADAKRGFAPLHRFRESGEPKRIAAARLLAEARRLWRHIDPAARRPPDGHLLALYPLVEDLYASGPSDEDELAAVFSDACAGQPELRYFDARQLAAFVVRRRLEHSPGSRGEALAAPGASERPALLIRHALPVLDRPPWLRWWFCARQRGGRAFGALAAACALSVAMAAMGELENRPDRSAESVTGQTTHRLGAGCRLSG